MDSSLLSTQHTGRRVVLQNGVIDSSILQETFFIRLKMFIMQRRKERGEMG